MASAAATRAPVLAKRALASERLKASEMRLTVRVSGRSGRARITRSNSRREAKLSSIWLRRRLATMPGAMPISSSAASPLSSTT